MIVLLCIFDGVENRVIYKEMAKEELFNYRFKFSFSFQVLNHSNVCHNFSGWKC